MSRSALKWMKGYIGSPQGLSLLFYLFLGVLAFFPCLFQGQTFFDVDLLNSNHLARLFLRDSLAHGHLPLWNPYLFGGQPFLADGDFMVCYPFLYLTLPFPVEYGFSIFYLSCFLIAALGAHFWAKGLGLSEEACRLTGVLFSLSGYFWWEVIHPPEMAAFVWVPWWAGALERASKRLSPGWSFAAGLFFAFLFTAGNFQLTMGALYGGAAYFLFRLWERKPWAGLASPGRAWGMAVLSFAWGALPLLAFWIPAWEFMSRCGRLLEPKDYTTFLADYSLDPSRVWRFLFPADAHPGLAAATSDDVLANAGYLGPWALFLGGYALWKPNGRFPVFLGAAALGAWALACGRFLPLHRWFCDWVPGFGLARAPFRYIFLYGAVLSVLAAAGFERFRGPRGKGGSSIGPLVFAGLVIVLGLKTDGHAWIQGAGAAVGGVTLWALARGGKKVFWNWVFVLSVAGTLLATAPWIRTSRLGPFSNFKWKDRCPMLFKLSERTGLARTFLGDGIPYPLMSQAGPVTMTLPPDAAMVAGLRNDSGYNPLCLKSVSDLFSLPAATHVKLMAVRSFVTGNESHLAGFRCEDWEGVHYCENKSPVSFVYAPRRVQTVSSDQDRLALMRRPDYDPYQVAFLSEPVSLFTTKQKAGLTYALEKGTTDQETFRVSLKRAGYAIFSEVMFPGWKALVDGKPTALFTANHAFRALWLEAGDHQVEFRYEPAWEWPILVGLLLWVVSLGLWGMSHFQRWVG